ncbi:HDOD domain-containing protein [Arsukibacterium sp.]|uniref:HDOD domain-containing protein n=1 Tax=Arsukibacterium sp. TaxID=1977258 RepID=UPI00299ED728|nr:HDOD domain-containing protein [Arsukibacterium sp.]MDX1676458.1 HDOD domain-containing protein [Arsukibacterium sp.]
MRDDIRRPANQWIELLAEKELPAITSIASLLDKFSNDDTSSIPKLSKAILHDQALSSTLLKVVNTTHHASIRKVTTVSRAAIVLGIQAVKNICLTSKILEGLLQAQNLSPDVYDRLLMLMANAFYAGLLAKMMVPDYSDDTQEEVYLAAMLYHIGETSFWSTGSELTEQLIKKVDLPAAEFEQHCFNIVGVRFHELSAGLAKTWNLGDLLIKSLDQPESRAVEMQSISLANRLSAAINSPVGNKAELARVLHDISKIMKIDRRQLIERIEQTRLFAINLLGSYGASILEDHIKSLPKNIDFLRHDETPLQPAVSSEKAVLLTLQELTRLTMTGTHINELLAVTVRHIAKVIDFSSCAFWILSSDKSNVESRLRYDNHGQIDSYRRSLSLRQTKNLISLVIDKDNAIVVNDHTQPKWRNFITAEIEQLIGKGAVAIAPVKISNKVIGIISGQFSQPGKKITDEQFSQFCFIIEHLNMCLMISTQKT